MAISVTITCRLTGQTWTYEQHSRIEARRLVRRMRAAGYLATYGGRR